MIESCSRRARGGDRSPHTARAAAVVDQAPVGGGGHGALRLGMGLAPERYRSLREMTTSLICPAFSGLLSPAIRAAAGPRVVWKRSRMGILERRGGWSG